MPDTAVELMQVEVGYSATPRTTEIMQAHLPKGATVRDALKACGLWARMADAPAATSARADGWKGLRLAVFGAQVTLDAVLTNGDRLDCCRPLRVDPKLARRERFNQQGARRSGLFAKRRSGSASGY